MLGLKLQNLLLVKRLLLLLRLGNLLLLTSENLLLLLELQKLGLALSLDLLKLLGRQSGSLLLSESGLLGQRKLLGERGSGKLRLLGKGGSLLRLLRASAKGENGRSLLEPRLRLALLASVELLIKLQQSLDLFVVLESGDLLLSQLGTLRGRSGGSGLLGRKGGGLRRSYFGESNSGNHWFARHGGYRRGQLRRSLGSAKAHSYENRQHQKIPHHC